VSPQWLHDVLSDPEVYPHQPESVRILQTHISLVAIVPPRVYKVKKPVDLGFLDFTDRDARRHYCEQEVRLNRRLCEGVYEAVVPLVDTGNGIRVDPGDAGWQEPGDLDSRSDAADGEVVDWAVRMRYMEPSHFLHRRLRDDRLPDDALARVAGTLCAFYRERTSTPDIAESGWIDRVRVSFDENFEQTADHVGEALTRPAFEALQFYVDRFFDCHAALFHRRRAEGHILNCHGDLRLEHVHLTPERVCIYDCIEFNERFRHIDVANDVAFLAMDLDSEGRPDLSRAFVRRIAQSLDDPDLLRLVPFYKSYRAYVRGKVQSMRAAEGEVPPDERAESRAQARRHYQWALRYAVAGSEPMVAVVMGRSGTGKSTQAAALAEALGWAHLSSDRIRKTRAGVPLHVRPDDATREQLYASETSAATYATLQARALDRAQRHKGTILDATYSRRADRDALREACRDAGVPLVFVELVAPDDTLKDRLAARDDATDVVSDARAEDFDLLTSRYEAPDALEDARHLRVASEADPAATTTDILQRLVRIGL
jgi:aminoglycoside phosphotransferase family enzyme/predicted kinase